MRLIFGTKNQAKINQIKGALIGLNIEIVGLPDIDLSEIAEDGKTAQENAKKKALGYSRILNQPVLSMDNALYIDGLPKEKQPGINVRKINNRTDRPSDQELLNYYSKLINNLGKKVNGHWEFALCISTPEGKIKEDTIISPRTFVSKSSNKTVEGYPLESIQIDLESGKYISEMTQEEQNQFWQKAIGGPLKEFIKNSLGI